MCRVQPILRRVCPGIVQGVEGPHQGAHGQGIGVLAVVGGALVVQEHARQRLIARHPVGRVPDGPTGRFIQGQALLRGPAQQLDDDAGVHPVNSRIGGLQAAELHAPPPVDHVHEAAVVGQVARLKPSAQVAVVPGHARPLQPPLITRPRMTPGEARCRRGGVPRIVLVLLRPDGPPVG